MSPASKSKSKEKTSTRAAKEEHKTSPKLPGSTNTGHSCPPSSHHPTFETSYGLDMASFTFSPPHHTNGNVQNMDDTDQHSVSSNGTLAEYESLSNTGRYSGESEDHKEKMSSTASSQEIVPGSDNDKRDKIRLKNERKHQRQKERRAQELHERCTGYLMSRKLEALSQQLVAMGFSHERAMLALMLNEGKVEESVNWLFEGSEEDVHNKEVGNAGNFKIDISEELALIAVMEASYGCSKQEVERAVVACEGDLDKAEVNLAARRPEPSVAPPKPEEMTSLRHPMRPQEPRLPVSKNRDEREFNYAKGVTMVSIFADSGSTNMQSQKPIQPISFAENWRPPTGSSSSVAPATQVMQTSAKRVSQLIIGGNKERYIQQGLAVREPVIMMQHPQSINKKQNPVTSSSLQTNGSYGSNVMGMENMKLNNKLPKNQSLGEDSVSSQHLYLHVQSTKKPGSDNLSLQRQHYYTQSHNAQQTVKSSSLDKLAMWSDNSQRTKTIGSPSLTVPSSLGLFSGWGSTGALGSSSQVDWNAGEMMSFCDYNSIDWSLNSNISSPSSKSSKMMLGLSSMRFAYANGIAVSGSQIGGTARDPTSSGGPREWTSPFAGKDIFRAPRQFVTAPSPLNFREKNGQMV